MARLIKAAADLAVRFKLMMCQPWGRIRLKVMPTELGRIEMKIYRSSTQVHTYDISKAPDDL